MSQRTDHGHHRHTSQGHHHGAPQGHHHDNDDLDWDVMGPMLEQEAEVSRPQYEEAARWIAGLPTAPQVRRVLDIGSGPGVISCLLAEVFPEAEVVAVDATPALLERTRARAEKLGLGDRVRTRHADIPDDLEGLGEADLIWVGNALHHMGDQRAVLAGFAALLRPGGTVALAEGGLQPRRLPRDIGMGRPGLEARLEAINAERFENMRAALPGAKRETEDWSALIAAVGLEPQGTRSFLARPSGTAPRPGPRPCRRRNRTPPRDVRRRPLGRGHRRTRPAARPRGPGRTAPAFRCLPALGAYRAPGPTGLTPAPAAHRRIGVVRGVRTGHLVHWHGVCGMPRMRLRDRGHQWPGA